MAKINKGNRDDDALITAGIRKLERLIQFSCQAEEGLIVHPKALKRYSLPGKEAYLRKLEVFYINSLKTQALEELIWQRQKDIFHREVGRGYQEEP